MCPGLLLYLLFIFHPKSVCLIYAASALVWYALNKEVDVAFGKTCDDRFPSAWSSGEAQTPSPVTLSPVASLPPCRPWMPHSAQHLLEGMQRARHDGDGLAWPPGIFWKFCTQPPPGFSESGWSQSTVPGPYLNLSKYLLSE